MQALIEIVKRDLAELEASQRATAEMLGISHTTIQNDIGNKLPKDKNIDTDFEEVMEDTGNNLPPVPNL